MATPNGGSSGGGSGGGIIPGPGPGIMGSAGMASNSPAFSWYDYATQSPRDPRTIVQSISFMDQTGATQLATFLRSTTWLQAATWVAPPMDVTPRTTFVPTINAPFGNDFQAQELAAQWNAQRAMTVLNAQYPIAVQKEIILRAGMQFANLFALDFTGGATSTDIQFSFLQNSLTSGDFTSGASGTIPVFAFPSATYGGTSRVMTVTLLRPGRYAVALRIKDNTGNYSLFEMDWLVF